MTLKSGTYWQVEGEDRVFFSREEAELFEEKQQIPAEIDDYLLETVKVEGNKFTEYRRVLIAYAEYRLEEDFKSRPVPPAVPEGGEATPARFGVSVHPAAQPAPGREVDFDDVALDPIAG